MPPPPPPPPPPPKPVASPKPPPPPVPAPSAKTSSPTSTHPPSSPPSPTRDPYSSPPGSPSPFSTSNPPPPAVANIAAQSHADDVPVLAENLSNHSIDLEPETKTLSPRRVASLTVRNKVTLPEHLPVAMPVESELESVLLTDTEGEYRQMSGYGVTRKDIPDAMLSPLSIPSLASSPGLSPLASDFEVFNPFQLASKRSLAVRSEHLMESLRFHAVSLSVEVFGLQRSELFWKGWSFVAVFVQGVSPGEWIVFDQSEATACTEHMRFLKKFSLRAGTEVDRGEKMMVGVFPKEMRKENVVPGKSIGCEEFCVGELLEAQQMIVEKDLKAGRKGGKAKGTVLLALEMIYHMERDHVILIDFGFLDTAPVRNRMYFVLSRAVGRGKWSPVYQSEIRLKNNVNKFNTVSLKGQEFHGGDVSRLFRLEVFRAYKNGKSKLLGFMQSSCEKLAVTEVDARLYWWPAREGILGAKILVQNVDVGATESWFNLRLAAQ